MIGILCTGVFITFGDALGLTIYNNKLAGSFMVILAWLCPFLYLTSTLSSVINGLGKAYITLINSVVGLSIRILFVVFAIPKLGIWGYLIGVLVSQFVISLLDLWAITKNIRFQANLVDWIVKPGLLSAILGFFFYEVYLRFCTLLSFNKTILLFATILCYCGVNVVLLYLTKLINIKEIKA